MRAPVRAAAGRYIVLAEDDIELSRLLVEIVRRTGAHALLTRNGLDLLDLVLAWYYPGTRAHPIDAIVSDLRMPGLGGWDVLDVLHGSGVRIPVVLMTAFSDDEVEAEARRRGVVALLRKPFEPDELCVAIEQATARRVA